MRLTEPVKAAARLLLRAPSRENTLYEWWRRLTGEPKLPPGPIRKVLVVCDGNVCRSPFAAALLSSRLPELGVRSAGLAASQGDEADPVALVIGSHWGLSLCGHRTHSVMEPDVEWADLTLGMEGRHAAEIVRRWPGARTKTRLLGHFLATPPYAIPDPWGQPEEVAQRTYERIGVAVDRLATLLREGKP